MIFLSLMPGLIPQGTRDVRFAPTNIIYARHVVGTGPRVQP